MQIFSREHSVDTRTDSDYPCCWDGTECGLEVPEGLVQLWPNRGV